MNAADLKTLVERQRDGFSLEQAFYLDPDIYKHDLEKIILPQWHLVDHVSRIPNAGDYFLCEMLGESVIVIRGRDMEVRAFYNVCRHRGSIICQEKEGNTKLLRCPYHAWSYDLDGSLKAARLMQDDFKPEDYSLHPCHIGICEGMIFLNFSKEVVNDFAEMVKPMLPFIEIQGLGQAKIAHRASYPTDANWKLVLENFYECYHCMPAHPEYCVVHPKDFVLAYGAGAGSGPIESEIAYQPQLDAFNAKADALGHPTGNFTAKNMSGGGRTAIGQGYVSETKDGTAAAPLMGNHKDWDGGYTGVAFNIFASLLMPNDFCTIFRFIPHDEDYTDVEIIWLVNGDAEEGKDYDLEKMTWLWDVTTIADKTIIEDNNAGVKSSRYEPGPYSRHEAGTNGLIQWYLQSLA